MSAFSSRAGSEFTTGFSVTPGASHPVFRSLWVGGAGSVEMIAENSNAAGFSFNFAANTFDLKATRTKFANLAAGTLLTVRGAYVLPNTTATNLVGLA